MRICETIQKTGYKKTSQCYTLCCVRNKHKTSETEENSAIKYPKYHNQRLKKIEKCSIKTRYLLLDRSVLP